MGCVEGKVKSSFFHLNFFCSAFLYFHHTYKVLERIWLLILCLRQGTKLAKEYEKQGGGYENEPGSKNEPRKGEPQPKSESKSSET